MVSRARVVSRVAVSAWVVGRRRRNGGCRGHGSGGLTGTDGTGAGRGGFGAGSGVLSFRSVSMRAWSVCLRSARASDKPLSARFDPAQIGEDDHHENNQDDQQMLP